MVLRKAKRGAPLKCDIRDGCFEFNEQMLLYSRNWIPQPRSLASRTLQFFKHIVRRDDIRLSSRQVADEMVGPRAAISQYQLLWDFTMNREPYTVGRFYKQCTQSWRNDKSNRKRENGGDYIKKHNFLTEIKLSSHVSKDDIRCHQSRFIRSHRDKSNSNGFHDLLGVIDGNATKCTPE